MSASAILGLVQTALELGLMSALTVLALLSQLFDAERLRPVHGRLLHARRGGRRG